MTFKVSSVKKKISNRKGRPLLAMLAMLVSLFVLTACPAPGPSCIEADEWGQTENITVRIDPKKKFNPSGISVRSGEPLNMTISGVIDLCPVSQSLNKGSNPAISPAVSGWQDSGITVTKDDKFVITVDGSYYDRKGEQKLGSGLYAYITPDVLTDDSPENSDWWYGKSSNSAPSSNRKAVDGDVCHPNPADPDECNPFFELYDNGTTGANGSGYVGVAPRTGKLYFRYARTASARGLDNSGDGDSRFSPWKGAYKWIEHDCNVCRQTTINLTCLSVSAIPGAYPICVAAWQGACANEKKLEYAVSNWSKYTSSRCQEWYGPTAGASDSVDGGEYRVDGYWGDNGYDHWVDENYIEPHNASTGTTAYNNGAGYTITVSHGCPGTYGKYLQMDIGGSDAALVPVVPPCPDNSRDIGGACIVNGTDERLYTAEFSVSPVTVTDLNSSGYNETGQSIGLPAGFTSRGKYSSVVPGSGELWFEVKDTATEANTNYPQGAHYEDNLGSYTISVRTTKINTDISGLLNGFIEPIRKIIFGYCRISDNPATTGINEAKLNSSLNEEDCNKLGTPDAWQSGITQRMYSTLVTSTIFIDAVRAGLVLLVVIYGMYFMLGGVTDDTQDKFIKRVIRVAIIIQLISPGSWAFFNQYLFTFFIDGMNQLIAIIAGDFMGAVSLVDEVSDTPVVADITNPFAFVDGTMSKFLNTSTLIKLSSLFFVFPIGPIYILCILGGMVFFLYAVVKAAILYALAMLAISLLLILGPIFIAFLMFDYTKAYFASWIKVLTSYLMQPVLVFTALSIFNVFIYSAIYTVLHFRVCWEPIFESNIPFGALGNIHMVWFEFYKPVEGQDGNALLSSGMPIGFFMILIFIIIVNALVHLVDFMAELASHITAGTANLSLSKAAGEYLGSSMAALKGAAGLAIGAAKGGGNVAGKGASNAAKSVARKDINK